MNMSVFPVILYTSSIPTEIGRKATAITKMGNYHLTPFMFARKYNRRFACYGGGCPHTKPPYMVGMEKTSEIMKHYYNMDMLHYIFEINKAQ
jgi:hypothetical protein